jgi:hypothetical protein
LFDLIHDEPLRLPAYTLVPANPGEDHDFTAETILD